MKSNTTDTSGAGGSVGGMGGVGGGAGGSGGSGGGGRDGGGEGGDGVRSEPHITNPPIVTEWSEYHLMVAPEAIWTFEGPLAPA